MAKFKQNSFYNDPQIGQAFDNLSSLFAPPTGQDAYAWSEANASRQKAQRLQDFFNYANGPAPDRTKLDALGIGTGAFNPNQSYYAVDQGNATSAANNAADNTRAITTNQADNQRALQQTNAEVAGRRDLKLLEPFAVKPGEVVYASPEAQTAYGAPGTLSNFYATDSDNATKLQMNEADNTRALQQTGVEQSGALDREKLKPLVAGEGQTLYLSPEAQSVFGQPDMVRGNISLQPGETNVLPYGGRLEGQAKPPTTDEVTAAILGRQDQATQNAYVQRDIPTEQVQTPNGPQIVRRSDAVGQTPVPPVGQKLETQNYIDANGGRGTAYFDQGARSWVDTVTKQPVAPTSTFSGSLTGADAASFGGATTANMTAATNLDASANAMSAAVKEYRTLLQNNPGIAGAPGSVRALGQDLAQVMTELSSAWGDQAPQAAVTLNEITGMVNKYAGNYDPNIQHARLLEAELAYRWAQMQNPSGEVSRQAYQRAGEALRGGILPNNLSALAGLDSLQGFIDRAHQQAADQRNPNRNQAPTAAAAAVQATPSPAAPTPAAPGGVDPMAPRVLQTPAGAVTIQRIQ